jgi:hypothetical protein
MSSTIELRLFGDEKAPPASSMRKLAHAVSAWPRFDGSWRDLWAWQGAARNRVAAEASPMSSDCLEERACALDGPDRKLAAGCSIPFWIFGDKPPEMGRLRLQVNAWGPQYGDPRFRDPQLDGFASILIERAGPLYAALGPRAVHHDVYTINTRVQENVDAVLQLIDILHEWMSLTSIKVFDDNGLALPFNAHFAYYRDPPAVARDLRYLSRVWEEGLPWWYPDDPPMKSLDTRAHAIYWHLLRSDSERERLRGRLALLLPHASQLSDESVRDVLVDRSVPIPMLATSGRLDFYHPQFMINHFIDEGLLAVLSAAITA